MYKRLEFYPEDKNGVEMELIHPGVLTKTAEVSSELSDFIKTMNINDGKVYVLVNALSAGEYYGPNRNGDYIGEPVLLKYHKNFEDQGHVFKHHKNKDPKTALGKILFSHYNDKMHRVELVCELDENRDERFIRRIQEGEYPAVSMGMRTPFDQCSICGHKSKRLTEYCDHLKYQMNRVYPDGRKVYAINPAAKFFDISFVIIPADRTAGVMRKLASTTTTVKSGAELGEEFLRMASLKEADLYKEVVTETEVKQIIKDPNGNIYLSQPLIPKKQLKEMAKSASMGEICSTLVGMQIMPKPLDFQRLALYSMGHEKLAEALDNEKILLINVDKNTKPIIPEDFNLSNFNDKLAKKYAHLIPKRALTKPLIVTRILEKVAFMDETKMEEEGRIPDNINYESDKEDHEFYLRKEPSKIRQVFLGYEEDPKLLPIKNPAAASAVLSGLFYGVQKFKDSFLPVSKVGELDAFLLRRPWLISLLIGATAYGSVKAQKNMYKYGAFGPNSIVRALIAVPLTYLYAGSQETKVRKGQPIGPVQNLIRKYPFLSSLATTWSLGKVQKALLKFSSYDGNIAKIVSSLSENKLDNLFNDVVNL